MFVYLVSPVYATIRVLFEWVELTNTDEAKRLVLGLRWQYRMHGLPLMPARQVVKLTILLIVELWNRGAVDYLRTYLCVPTVPAVASTS